MSDFFCNFGTPLKGPSEIIVQQCCAFRQVFPQKNIADAITFFSAVAPAVMRAWAGTPALKMHLCAIFLREDLQMCIFFCNFAGWEELGE